MWNHPSFLHGAWPRRSRCSRFRWVTSMSEEYRLHIARWLLRLLGNLRVDVDEGNAIRVIKAVGLEQAKLQGLNHSRAIDAFRKKLTELEQQPLNQTGVLYSNINYLSDLIGLNHVEKELLAFSVLLNTSGVLRECLDGLRVSFATSVCEVLALALGVEQSNVRLALRQEGALRTAGLHLS